MFGPRVTNGALSKGEELRRRVKLVSSSLLSSQVSSIWPSTGSALRFVGGAGREPGCGAGTASAGVTARPSSAAPASGAALLTSLIESLVVGPVARNGRTKNVHFVGSSIRPI